MLNATDSDHNALVRVQWCERWNLGVSNDMMLLALHAHTADVECIHVGSGEANLTSTLAVATVFVPVDTQ